MKRAFPVLSILTAILLSYALYQALVVAPTEQTMGDVQRIFYYHVPSAWTAFFLFFINFVASIQYLARANSKTDRLASYLAVGIGVVVFAAAFFTPLPEGMRPSAVGTTGLLATGLYLLVRSLFSQADTDVLLRFGEMATGSSFSSGEGGTSSKESGAVQGERRYLFVTVSYNPARAQQYAGEGKGTSERGKELERELRNRFADWYYIISGADFQKLRPLKKDLIRG